MSGVIFLNAQMLAVRLAELGVASTQQLEEAKQELGKTQERFSAVLARRGVLRDVNAGKRLALQLGVIPQRLAVGSMTPPQVGGQIPSAMWRGHHLVPIEDREGTLLLATDDPLSAFAGDYFAARCGRPVEIVLVREEDLAALLEGGASRRESTGTTPSPKAAGATSPGSSPSTPATKQATVSSNRAGAVASPATIQSAAQQAPPDRPQAAESEKRAPSQTVSSSKSGTPQTPQAPSPGTSPAQGRPATPSARLSPAPAAKDTKMTPSMASVPAAGRVSVQATSRDASGPEALASQGSDEPIIRLVDSILSEAVRMRASDVHIEPGMHEVRVRYRVDGVLHDVNSPPKALQGPVMSRVKIMASLNIAEKRLPQDGRLQLTVEGRALDVRVSVLPASHGESIVMRLLDRSQPIRGLPEMGLASESQQLWEELIHRPHGLVLVTGPTGSGKTTTLYGALAMLNQPDRKLITVEDPVEYQLAGVNQVQVKPGVGLSFAAGLRAMLRQAPDIIMVGEIRDQETGQISIQAALTGHLVLSTLHTNDAPSAITRLIDMGVAPFLVASTAQGVLAQRLVRRICQSCQSLDEATVEERSFLGEPHVTELARGKGCDACHGSGFFGRVGIFELLVVSERIRQLIVGKPTASAIRAIALQEGMRGLREDGCGKIRKGLTTMEEVLRVIVGSEE